MTHYKMGEFRIIKKKNFPILTRDKTCGKFIYLGVYVIVRLAVIWRQVWQVSTYLELHARQLVHDLTEGLSDDIPRDLRKEKW